MDDETSETKVLRLLNAFFKDRRQQNAVVQTQPAVRVGAGESVAQNAPSLEAWPIPWQSG
jgi:hypothetical protein